MKEQVIELAKQAGAVVEAGLAPVFSSHAELHRFATLVRNAALDEAAQKCEYIGPKGSALSVINSAFAHEIRNLKEPTP